LKSQGDLLLVRLYGKAGDKDALGQMAHKMQLRRTLELGEQEAILDAAVACGDWDLAQEHSDLLLRRGTREVIRAEAGEKELSDGQVESAVKRYRGKALFTQGRAALELGYPDTALERFTEVDQLAERSYVEYPVWPFESLDVHWGKALLRAGRHADAAGRVAVEAAILGNSNAEEVFREAYLAMGDDGDGYDRYLEHTREKAAKKVPEFTAYDYEGKEISYTNLKGRVTLLAFWFPT